MFGTCNFRNDVNVAAALLAVQSRVLDYQMDHKSRESAINQAIHHLQMVIGEGSKMQYVGFSFNSRFITIKSKKVFRVVMYFHHG